MTAPEDDENRSWIEAELEETLDELFESEFNQPILTEELRKIYKDKHPDMLDRRTYYKNLLRLQVELIKLQDWVQATGAKVLILCEGRDSAGKGGVIKRITQRLNPRVARYKHRQSVRNHNGIFNAMSRTYRRVVKSFYLIVHGITAQVSNG